MNNGWTPERKAKQALAIQQWKPWLKSTGPKSAQGKAVVARNPFKGAIRPKYRDEMLRLKLALRMLDYAELLDRVDVASRR